ncbi:UNVERIFIED_CONTAM: hypothetical protein Sradi_5707200 [Sesamum radiatum]|uniref:Uncharacterized protein n=1 Tax=Sesamum radiatum TaxID=300843 RepID=A0AAW2L116_SESRA
MSRSSHLELLATDSQALDPPDSVSHPSEPPDIRKWFSSYIYESPELNTLDGFGDFNGSGEICLEEEKEGKFGENVGKSDDGLLSAGKESSDGIAKCDEYVKSAAMVFEFVPYHLGLRMAVGGIAMVTGSSEALSFCSEPPDIKNWFSSYLHESPPLDATDDFTSSDCDDGKLSTTQKSCRKDTKDVMNFIHVEESRELLSHNRKSDVVVECTNLVKCTNLNDQSVCKDSHDIHLKRSSSTPSQLTSKMVSEQMLPGQETGNHDHDFGGKFGNENAYGKTYNLKLDCSLIENTSPKILNMEINTGSQVGKSLHKSIGTKNCVKDSLVKKELDEIVSAGALDLSEPKGDSWRRPTYKRSIGKENKETNLLGNGFISTRKNSSQANTGNVMRHVLVQTGSLRNEVKPAVILEKDGKMSRKVLFETSNLHSPNVLESTGKWCCPQKNKPSLGPPLKQLRLEQWVRRV